ncbi:hypothetical protein [Roseiflexus sp. RS-1]|jgi:hypothetical protein|uniref:hypothetical protein n=1 Tax=Roseiflexus sp. (strain RS-1) TaxID=357808 RepID=UPI0000D819D1|nr:hypothetical protein [Roseiflexus sp. RS-1]ABQ89158.1 hypothetical protein RoseRS_0742 [Roseiflexus sp. RS-1]
MDEPNKILSDILGFALERIDHPFITEPNIQSLVESVCRQMSNRACTRLLMACMLAKIHQPQVDPRKPYTAIRGDDAFSGRSYDEKYITRFIIDNRLPLNTTTAFLTPAFRNLDKPLEVDLNLVGRPAYVYKATLELLDYTYRGKVSASDLLSEIVRVLLVIRKENQERIDSLLRALRPEDTLPLSSEEIVILIDQHLKCKNSSRLPVLIVAAAYNAMEEIIGERILPLQSHNAADEQTGSLGDVEVCLENDDHIVTVYEMKMRRVTIDDINFALEKIKSAHHKIHNYIFITTETIDDNIMAFAAGCYERTGGTEVAILDCISFLRHFLHLFHRSRTRFLDAYQKLVLEEPESAVSQPLKEAFLALRRAAQDRGEDRD